MLINIKNLVSMTDANRNFSKVARLVDENGAAVILKNNVPKYVLIECSQFASEEFADSETVNEIGKQILTRHKKAFEELSK